jgi:hypothetical protein
MTLGWKLATEVARTARQHKEKEPNHRNDDLAPFLYGGTPKRYLNYFMESTINCAVFLLAPIPPSFCSNKS